MGILRSAWRNLWRNPRRTAVTLAALAVNTAVLCLFYSLRTGLMTRITHDATHLVIGDVQIHALGYRPGQSLPAAIPNPEAFLAAMRSRGVLAAPRAYGQGLLSTGARSAGALIRGVNPAAEQAGFDLPRRLASGKFLAAAPKHEIILGQKLAATLQARVGGELVVVVQGADGSLGNDFFLVAGILAAAGEDLDRRAAFIHERDFGELFASGGRVHEVALNGQGRWSPGDLAALASACSAGIEAMTWREVLPNFAGLLDLWRATSWIYGLIFGLAAMVGVANTMLMATYERIPEFGLQKALGATPRRIVRDVAVEASLLAVTAAAAGSAIGVGAAVWLRSEGLNIGRFLSGNVTFSGVVLDPVLRPVLSTGMVTLPCALMTAVGVLGALYPAIKAATTEPIQAMNQP